MNNSRTLKGFTLLELLIALSIFTVMVTIAYGGLRLVIDGNMQLEQSATSLSALQRAFLFLKQDLEQAVPRGVRDEYGAQDAPFVCCAVDKLLHLTSGGIDGALVGAPDIRRVEYYLIEGRLERRVWSTLDRVKDNRLSRLQLMESVQSIDIKFIGYGDTEWQSSLSSDPGQGEDVLPRAVEVIITTERFGAVSRLFIIGS